MRRLLWVLPVLLLATSAWGKESWVGFSVRPARDGTSPCDYEAEVGIRIPMFSGEIERERQNGQRFINKRATLDIPVGRILAAGEYNDIPERAYRVAAGAALWRAAQGLSVGAGLESFDEGFHSWHPTLRADLKRQLYGLDAGGWLSLGLDARRMGLSVKTDAKVNKHFVLRPSYRYEETALDEGTRNDYQGKIALVLIW